MQKDDSHSGLCGLLMHNGSGPIPNKLLSTEHPAMIQDRRRRKSTRIVITYQIQRGKQGHKPLKHSEYKNT